MKLIEHVEVVDLFAHGLIGIRPYFLGPDVLQDGFRLFRIIPEISLVGNPLFVFDFYAFSIVVKDTSSRQPRGPSRLSIGLWS
jgi:hypothetical protein